MKSYKTKIISIFSALLFAPMTMAATVEMTWTEPGKYRDIKSGEQSRKHFEKRVFKNITEHFEKLAENLPEGYTLKIDVTDIDLAGDVNIGGIRRIRIVKDLYFPRMKFSYELVGTDSQVVASDEVNVKDMSFMHSSRLKYENKSFGYEKKMLDEWFDDTLKQYYKTSA